MLTTLNKISNFALSADLSSICLGQIISVWIIENRFWLKGNRDFKIIRSHSVKDFRYLQGAPFGFLWTPLILQGRHPLFFFYVRLGQIIPVAIIENGFWLKGNQDLRILRSRSVKDVPLSFFRTVLQKIYKRIP